MNNKTIIKDGAKKQLWRMGHKVQDLSGTPGISYDLLVDGKLRVAVFSGDKNVDCDIFMAIKSGDKQYALKAEKLHWQKFTKVFGQRQPKQKV